MAGGGGQTTSGSTYNISQQNNDPWHYAAPALGQALNSSIDTFWKLGGTSDSMPAVAETDPWLSEGENRMISGAYYDPTQKVTNPAYSGYQSMLSNQGMSDAQRSAVNNLSPYASGQYLKENPYLDATLKKSMEDASNAANAQFSAAGRYGSGAHAGALGKELGGIQSQARLADYYKQQENQMNANQLMAGIGQQGIGNMFGAGKGLSELYMARQLAPQSLQEIGNQRMQREQNRLDLQRETPWRNVSNLANIATAIGGMGGSSSGVNAGYQTQRTSQSGGALGSILGGGMTGLSFLRNMGGLSGLGSLFTASDVRLKEDIQPVGTTFDGQNIYSYRYKSGGPKVMGLMAQEVLQHKPQAVAQDPESGMLMVNYDEATS